MVKKILNNFLNILENNEYLILYITSIIILYVCFIGEKIPYFIENIFKNKIIKMIAISLIIFRAPNNTFMSIMYTLAFLITIDKSSNNKVNKIKKEIEMNEKNKSNKENFTGKVYTPDDFSYENELDKLIKIKENFAETIIPMTSNNCKSVYKNYEDDFNKYYGNEERLFEMGYVVERCKENNESNFPEPKVLLKKINDYEKEYEKYKLQSTLDMLNKLKDRYNIYRKIFTDYKKYEQNNQEKINNYTWIENVVF